MSSQETQPEYVFYKDGSFTLSNRGNPPISVVGRYSFISDKTIRIDAGDASRIAQITVSKKQLKLETDQGITMILNRND